MDSFYSQNEPPENVLHLEMKSLEIRPAIQHTFTLRRSLCNVTVFCVIVAQRKPKTNLRDNWFASKSAMR